MASLAAPCLLLAALWLLLFPGQCLSAAVGKQPHVFLGPLPPAPAALTWLAAVAGAAPAVLWWPLAPHESPGSGDCSLSLSKENKCQGSFWQRWAGAKRARSTVLGSYTLIPDDNVDFHTAEHMGVCYGQGQLMPNYESAHVQVSLHRLNPVTRRGRVPVNAKTPVLPLVPRSVSANLPRWPAVPPHPHSHFHSRRNTPQFHFGHAAGDWKINDKLIQTPPRGCQNRSSIKGLTWIHWIICNGFENQIRISFQSLI